jgi:hypothetical protein
MIRKSGIRFSEKIMLYQSDRAQSIHLKRLRSRRPGERGNGATRAAPEDECRPAVEIEAPFERQRPIGRDHGVRLHRQQAGEDDARAGVRQPHQRRSDALQRSEQDVGEDEIERRVRAQSARRDAVGLHHLDQAAGSVEARIGARDAHRAGVDVGGDDAPAQRAGGGDGQHAATGAEIENARTFRHPEVAARSAALEGCRPTILRGSLRSHLKMTDNGILSIPRLANAVERDKAAARGAVMTGAEGERGLDFDADAVLRNAVAVVRAVHDETAGGDRLQPGKAFPHPIGRLDAREGDRRAELRPGGRRDRRPHRVLVRRRAKIKRDLPAAGARIGQADRDVGG